MTARAAPSRRPRTRRRKGRATPPRAARARPALGWRRSVTLILGAFVVTLGALTLALLGWGASASGAKGPPTAVDWVTTSDPHEAVAQLSSAGLAPRPLLLALYLRAFAAPEDFVPGPHLLQPGASAKELVQRLRRSALRSSVKLSVPEGFHHVQIAERLEAQGVVAASAFRAAVRDRALLEELGLDGESAEGWLFPATYSLPVDSDAKAVVRLMVREFRKRWARLSVSYAPQLDALRQLELGERQIVILASLVEKEARLAEERPLVASVYLNRLRDPEFRPRQMLQADPTAGYGCTVEPERAPSCADYAGKITPALLRDDANRWNTYRHAGLPPGAIANPGEASLTAVITAPRTDYLFFVHTGGGRHTFSRTLDAHQAATRESGPAP